MKTPQPAPKFILNNPDGKSRGHILLIHGSAPFDMDGLIPGTTEKDRYGNFPFFRLLAEHLASKGWTVYRYSKPGVGKTEINTAEYAKTDLPRTVAQIQSILGEIPDDAAPKIIFAWSEGTLAATQLDIKKISGMIFLGGISTNIAGVVKWQGGPGKEELLRTLSEMKPTEMLGSDRPAKRLLDEIHLRDNWQYLQAHQQLKMLVLHGSADREVPVSEVRIWEKELGQARVNTEIGEDLDHRFSDPKKSPPNLAHLFISIDSWLDENWPVN